MCVLATVNPHSNRVITPLFSPLLSLPSVSLHIIVIRLSGHVTQQLFVCVAVPTKRREWFFAHMVTREEMKDKCRRLNDNKFALAGCDGKPSDSNPLAGSFCCVTDKTGQ